MDLFIPTYFPDVLHFAALVRSKNVIFEVCDNYQKQTQRNRTYIAHAQGVLPLIVPIKHKTTGQRLKSHEVESEHAFGWATNHWKSIQTAYRTAPFFEFYEDELADLFSSESITLQAHNLQIIERLMELIGADLNYTRTASYQNNFSGNDWRYFGDKKHNRSVNFPHYIQVFESYNGFIPNCSVLDALFNLGPQTLDYLQDLSLPSNKH